MLPRHLQIAVLLAAVVSVAAAAPAIATVHPEAFPPRPSGLSFSFHGTSSEDEVHIDLGIYPEVHNVEDPAGVVGAVGNCQLLGPTAAECRAYDGDYLGRMRAGNDDVDMFGAAVDGELRGGDGIDFLSGSGGDEKIYGGKRDDDIYAGEGADLIDGGPGKDYLTGGINSDRIRAVDGEADSRIDCGPGSDEVAWIDRKIDPRPWRCERVVRVR